MRVLCSVLVVLCTLVPAALGRKHVFSGKLAQCECPVLQCPDVKCDDTMVKASFGNDAAVTAPQECPAAPACPVCPEPEPEECPLCQECPVCPLDLYNEYEPPLKDAGCREWQYLCIAEFLVMVMLAVAFIVYCMVPSDATIRAAREEKERQRLLTDRDERIKELESRVEMMGQALEDFENAAENNAAGTNDDEEIKASLVAAQAEAAELAQQLAKAQAAERDADALIESLTSGNKKLAVEVADLAAQLKKLKGDDTAAAAAAAAAKRIADLEAQVRNITAENVQAEKYASEAVAARDAALKRVTALEDAAKKNAADSVAMKTAHDEHVQNLEDEVAAHVTWRETTRLAKDATPTPAGDLATVNTQLTAQLSALHKEFNEYREAADKLIAELQQANAASTPAPAPAPLTSPTAASARPALSNVPRGASRLAKLGLEDPDEVAALKAQLAKLQERASALAAHLNHAKFIASQAVNTTAELKAQNVELKQELTVIATEFESFKEDSTKALGEWEAKATRDAEEIAALRAELEAARSATSAAERGGESPAQALVREHLAAEARVAALEAQLLGLERDLNSAQEATATALTQRETLKKSLTSVIEELKQQLQSVVEEYLSYKKTATAATTAADAARAQAEEDLATHMRGCRGGDTAALQARIDELEGYTKSAYAEFSSMTKKLADEKALCAQKDKRIAELEGGGGTNGAAATAAASAAAAAAAKADGEKAALVQELSEERAYAAQRVSSLEALAAVAATSAATKDREMAALQAELKDLRDKMMKLALEYQAYRSETTQQLDQLGKGTAGNGSNAGSDVAALRGELGAAQSELADVRRQLSLVEVQRNDMRRLLWTMREAATGKGASAGDGDTTTTWREVMGDAAPDPLEQTAGRSEGASSAAATAAGSGSDTSSYSGGGVVDLRKVPPAADTTTTSAASDTTSTGGLFSFLSGSPRK